MAAAMASMLHDRVPKIWAFRLIGDIGFRGLGYKGFQKVRGTLFGGSPILGK